MRFPTLRGHKYATLVVAVALFLVLDLGVLALNFLISSQIREDAVVVALSARLRLLAQNNAINLLQIDSAESTGRSTDFDRSELGKDLAAFDEGLRALRDGGEVEATDGSTLRIAALADPHSRSLLTQIANLWTPYRDLAQRYLDAPTASALVPLLQFSGADRYQLASTINDLTAQAEATAAGRAARLRAVQVGGIALATLNFVLILVHFIRRLRQGDAAAEKARKETAEILGTVNEGLFLLDRAGRIGAQHSRVTPQLLGGGELAGRDFFKLLAPRVAPKALAAARDYIDLLFGDRVHERLIASLNPLDQVELVASAPGAASVFLEFRFARVREAGHTLHLLVTLQDVTRRVLLAQELERLREGSQQSNELLGQVLRLDPAALRRLIDRARSELESINQRQALSAGDSLAPLVADAARSLHALKGDAAALGLERLAAVLHTAEDHLEPARRAPQPRGEDLLGYTQALTAVFAQLDLVELMVQRLSAFAAPVDPARAPANSAARLAGETAQALGKSVKVHTQAWEASHLPGERLEKLASVLHQLVRNAVVHGIETPQERLAHGKPETGSLEIALAATPEGGAELICRDDGAGLDTRRIAQAAVARGRLDQASAAQLDARGALRLLFEPHFSTLNKADEHGGRGVGLDLVRQTVRELGGRVRVTSQPGRGAEFRVVIPART